MDDFLTNALIMPDVFMSWRSWRPVRADSQMGVPRKWDIRIWISNIMKNVKFSEKVIVRFLGPYIGLTHQQLSFPPNRVIWHISFGKDQTVQNLEWSPEKLFPRNC